MMDCGEDNKVRCMVEGKCCDENDDSCKITNDFDHFIYTQKVQCDLKSCYT